MSVDAVRPRYEHKYVVSHTTVAALLARLEGIAEPAAHAVAGGYLVSSVYYDTADLQAYYEKLDGVDPRYKVRLRYYGEVTSEAELARAAAFLEIKHRRDALIHKNRVRVPGEALPSLVEGAPLVPRLADVAPAAPASEAALVERLVTNRPRQPYCLVRYRRRAFETPITPTLRITVDTDLRVAAPGSLLATTTENGTAFLPRNLAVVELKFHHAMPLWLLGICRELGMDLRRYSKYCAGLERFLPAATERTPRFQAAIRP